VEINNKEEIFIEALYLISIDFPCSKNWSDSQFEDFDLKLQVKIGNKCSKKEYQFEINAVSVKRLKKHSDFFKKHCVVLRRYNKTAIKKYVEEVIQEANEDGGEMGAFNALTYYIQYENEESLY
jgi:hypothetical protein